MSALLQALSLLTIPLYSRFEVKSLGYVEDHLNGITVPLFWRPYVRIELLGLAVTAKVLGLRDDQHLGLVSAVLSLCAVLAHAPREEWFDAMQKYSREMNCLLEESGRSEDGFIGRGVAGLYVPDLNRKAGRKVS